MNTKIVLLMILIFVFMGMSVLSLKFEVVKEGGTVYIRADGSIDPVTAPIERNGRIYTFKGDVNDSIVV